MSWFSEGADRLTHGGKRSGPPTFNVGDRIDVPQVNTTFNPQQLGPPAPRFGSASFTPGSMQSGYSSFPGSSGGYGGNQTFPSTPYGSGGSGGGNGGGMSTYEKLMLALNVGGGLASAYTQYHQNQQQNRQNQADQDERKREFDASQAAHERDQNLTSAPGLARSLDAAPMRDRAIYLMTQRLGMNPRQFQGETLTQPGSPGGIDPDAMAQANTAYRPGMGGTAGSTEVMKQILKAMGFPYGGGTGIPGEVPASQLPRPHGW